MTPVVSPPCAPTSWRPRDELSLVQAQLQGIEAFYRRHHTTVGTRGLTGNREQRQDEIRRLDVADRELRALLVRAEAAQRDEHVFRKSDAPRVVLAHRNSWLRDKIGDALRQLGMVVVASTDDGAEASAALAFEQPDVVLVEDLLPVLSGLEVIQRAQGCAPAALIAGHGAGRGGMRALSDAGARAVFSRRIPPNDIASHILRCLENPETVLLSV